MKRFLQWLIVPALILFGVLAYLAKPSTPRYAPDIEVVISVDGGVGGFTSDGVPAMNGAASMGATTIGSYYIKKTYKVVSTANGHFAVLAHYDVEQNGVLTPVDRTLPVWDKKPEQAKWLKLENHVGVFAYLNGSTAGTDL